MPSPLAVDLDGTLIRGDVTRAAALTFAQRRPFAFAQALPSLLLARAAFKRRLAEVVPAPVLTAREDVLAWLAAQRAAGRALHLVTGADQAYADAAAARFGLFDSAEGSDGRVNLVGAAKARRLMARFPAGFSYMGDSRLDLAVFAVARSIVLVGAGAGLGAAARALAPVEAEFS